MEKMFSKVANVMVLGGLVQWIYMYHLTATGALLDCASILQHVGHHNYVVS